MCEQCPPQVCRLCGNDATVVLVCMGEAITENNLFCAEHGEAIMSRASMMQATAPLN